MSPDIENGAGLEAVLYEERDRWHGGARTYPHPRPAPSSKAFQSKPNAVFGLPSAKALDTTIHMT